ncbi:heme-binding protein [uncultured Roseibium sp.]|uniref:GlcG/HbpS family heme-binding protein n=1 Tax=uncultured Roseibium sp. TaxID=1936171 RepID=UPI0026390FE2|nr:heme-binding protein [uncultured Roseibium sp.]
MTFVQETRTLTHQGALAILTAAVERAEQMGQPQCIVVVDANGEVLAEVRMTGAKFLSRKSALAKALTAASIGNETTVVPESVRTAIGLATEGKVTGLPGGLPIRLEGTLLGGIGVGSGSGDQDIEVARAGLAAIGA